MRYPNFPDADVITLDVNSVTCIAMSAGGVNPQRIAITKTGFRVTYTSSAPFPTINYANGTFDYSFWCDS